MRIGVICTGIFQLCGEQGLAGYGGLEIIAFHCAKGLAKFGHEVFLFAPDGSACEGVTIIPCGIASTVSEHEMYGGTREIKDQSGRIIKRQFEGYWPKLLELDCIIDHSWQKYSYMLKMEERLKAPVLGVIHAPVNTVFSSPPPIEKPCLVAISKDQGCHAEALHDNIKVRVCYNGIDTEFYKPISVQRTDRFLFLARFSSIKGADLAIKSCLEANVGLDVIGDTTITGEPQYFQECMRMSEQHSLTWDTDKGKQIKVIGGVLRGETVFYYSRARGMLHPNQRFREPLGLAPLESQACGAPCAAWDRGAMRETIDNGRSGFLVTNLNEMTNLLKNNAFDSIDRDYCRKWACNFSLDHMVRRYNELCEEAVQTGGW